MLKVLSGSVNPDGLLYNVFLAPNWLHYSIALFFIIIALMIVVSYFTKGIDASKITGLYLGSATPEQRAETRASWNKWDVINSVIIIAIVVVFYVYFW
ncbi:MAG: hypothetical protein FJY11_08300 [Bacteroidetes bacterium]|nr:hypothetical protein [Bacteroidota bacterium]